MQHFSKYIFTLMILILVTMKDLPHGISSKLPDYRLDRDRIKRSIKDQSYHLLLLLHLNLNKMIQFLILYLVHTNQSLILILLIHLMLNIWLVAMHDELKFQVLDSHLKGRMVLKVLKNQGIKLGQKKRDLTLIKFSLLLLSLGFFVL